MSKKIKIYIIASIVVVIAIVLFWQLGGRSVDIISSDLQDSETENNTEGKSQQQGQPNPVTGVKCENYNRRPIAVMLAEDSITRPLSGVGAADLVIEMPVITGSITRMMAVYICEQPEEIGSVRSARHDFIPLAMGLDAIYAHWGGSHFALDKLNAGIIDNIDALKNPYNTFWRKSYLPAPHNGFTSMDKLINAAQKLGYRLSNQFEGYPHIKNPKPENLTAKLTVGYTGNYAVYYEYDSASNAYKRWRGSTPEIDKLTNQQVTVKNVVIMRAKSRQIEGPYYNDVDVEGTGSLIVYRNGEEIKGTWKKEGSYQFTKLYFLDQKGKEIKFVPGKIWIEIVEPDTNVRWEPKFNH